MFRACLSHKLSTMKLNSWVFKNWRSFAFSLNGKCTYIVFFYLCGALHCLTSTHHTHFHTSIHTFADDLSQQEGSVSCPRTLGHMTGAAGNWTTNLLIGCWCSTPKPQLFTSFCFLVIWLQCNFLVISDLSLWKRVVSDFALCKQEYRPLLDANQQPWTWEFSVYSLHRYIPAGHHYIESVHLFL